MKILLKFGIGTDSNTFGLLRFAMPHYEKGVFKMGVFKTGKIKTGFAENLGHYRFWVDMSEILLNPTI